MQETRTTIRYHDICEICVATWCSHLDANSVDLKRVEAQSVSNCNVPVLYPPLCNTPMQVLTRWGGTLLELAHFRQGADAYDMIDQVSGKETQCFRATGADTQAT